MRRCTKCGVEKPRDAFSPEKKRKDGLRSHCKACCAESARRWRERNPEKAKESVQRWRAENPETVLEISRRWRRENPEKKAAHDRRYHETHRAEHVEAMRVHRERYPEKAKARRAVSNAVRDGRLLKPDRCEDCDGVTASSDLHGHHQDYSKPLEVEWLCRWCHSTSHREEMVA